MDYDDIKRQIRGNFLVRNFSFCSVYVKVKLFKSFCSNMYCCHLRSHLKKFITAKLEWHTIIVIVYFLAYLGIVMLVICLFQIP